MAQLGVSSPPVNISTPHYKFELHNWSRINGNMMEDDTNENREKVKMKKKSEVKIEQLKVIRTIGTGIFNISPN